MPDTCCVPGCHLRDGKEVKAMGISFHKFPRNATVRQCWLKAISRRGKDETEWVPGPGARVCSKHFSEEDFHPFANIRVLKEGRVPSLSPSTKPRQESTIPFAALAKPTVTKPVVNFKTIQQDHNYALLDPEHAVKKLQAYRNRIHDSEQKLATSRKQINRQQEKIRCLIAELARQKSVNC